MLTILDSPSPSKPAGLGLRRQFRLDRVGPPWYEMRVGRSLRDTSSHDMNRPILGWRKVGRPQRSARRDGRGRLAAIFVVLAIGFLLLVPDPHDHGDAGSLGGLLRLLLPGPATSADPHQTAGNARPEANGSCPIHFWQQVAATGLLLALPLRFFLSALFRIAASVTRPYVTDLGSFHSRAPPVFSS